MAGMLTTHVLDTVKGGPAVGLTLVLWKLPHTVDGATVPPQTSPLMIKTVVTNRDGRNEYAIVVRGCPDDGPL